MIKLTDFDKNKLFGFVYAANERYLESQMSFNDALKLKEDGQIYFQKAYNHIYLREYNEAQACAMKAIELGFDAYELYAKITVGNLADIDKAMSVLLDGASKQKASACFGLAYQHYDNNLNPDLRDPYKCMQYLELAYQYAKPHEKGLYAFRISNMYSGLLRFYPFLKDQIGNKPTEYLTIFNQYGGSFAPVDHINIMMFNEMVKNDDHSIVDLLFERFDDDAKLLFAFMLLEEEYKANGQSNVVQGLPYMLIEEANKMGKNPAAKLLYAYITPSSQRDLLGLYHQIKDYGLFVPNYYKDGFDAFMKCYEESMTDPNVA